MTLIERQKQGGLVKNKVIQFPKRDDALEHAPEQKTKYVHMAVSIVAAIFLVLLYIMIFCFSEQDGEESGSLSHKVTEVIVVEIGEITKQNWTDELRSALISYWENPVRKMAHFSEYACMGMLVFLMFLPWVTYEGWKKKHRKMNLLVILWVFLSASLDEWHQTFVAGRCGNFLDVLLDTSGGFFGLCVCLLLAAIFVRLKNRMDGKATSIVDKNLNA